MYLAWAATLGIGVGWLTSIYSRLSGHPFVVTFLLTMVWATLVFRLAIVAKNKFQLVTGGIGGFLILGFLLRNVPISPWGLVTLTGLYGGFVVAVWVHNIDTNFSTREKQAAGSSTHPSG